MARKNKRKIQVQASFLKFSRSQRRAIAFIAFASATFILVFKSGILEKTGDTQNEPFVAAEINRALVAKMPTPKNTLPSTTPTYTGYPSRKTAPGAPFQPGKLSFFDPNKVTFEQLVEMGLREKAAQNLVNYRAKGGKFKKPEDLGKLYGLHPGELKALIPFVQINPEAPTETIAYHQRPWPGETDPKAAQAKELPLKLIIDVNQADSLTWTMLPGIGGKRAAAILKYRSKLGGFSSVEQVGETFGLPDSVFQKIKPSLTWSEQSMEKLSINEATESQLKSHPYIGWQMAKIIVAYRDQHGPYLSVDDLLKIHIIRKDWLEKVKPYLKTGMGIHGQLTLK